MKFLTFASALIVASTLLSAGDVGASESQPSTPPNFQARIDQFLADHEVSGSTFYCRSDIATPECRVLMRFKDKLTGKSVNSFQIAFNAHSRQVGGTEFFLENTDGAFTRASDGTMDGKVNPVVDESNQVVEFGRKSLKIKDIKFGTLVADLTFDHKRAVVEGVREGQPVLLKYPRIK